MSLEETLVKLIEAVDANTKAFTAAAGTAAPKTESKAAAKTETKKAPKLTQEDVRVALNTYAKIEGKDGALAILKEVGGVESLAELDPDKYQAIIDRTK